MSSDETKLIVVGRVKEMAHRLLQFVHAVPAIDDFCVGYMLGEYLAGLAEAQTSDHLREIAWLIEIMGDCSAVLASALREDYLAKSDAQ